LLTGAAGGVELASQSPSIAAPASLPYRLHARPERVRAAYPRLDEFLEAKRRCDPQRRFRNLMWDKYFG
jgi:hypothetical protein